MKIKIDKGIPIPTGRVSLGLPWADMKVGDSFLAPADISRARVSSSAQYNANKLGWHFVIRMTPEGVRVWRDE